jgi:hypothetical protein
MYFQMLGLKTPSVFSVLPDRHGLIFLGTPHYESIEAPWQLIIQRIIQSASTSLPDVATPPNLRRFEYVRPPQGLVYTFIETDSVSCYCYGSFGVLLLIIYIDYATGMYKARIS